MPDLRCRGYVGSEIVKLLIEMGADVKTTSDYGWTFLALAKQGKQSETVDLPSKAGAE